jgi:hypothetical protein
MAVASKSTHALLPVLVALAACWASPAQASRLPDPVANGAYELRRVGAGDLSWLGRPVYQASLWTPGGRFEGYASGEPVALSLWYQRSFSRDQLVRITTTAWRLLDVPENQRAAWSGELQALWSDVVPGDNLTAVIVPGGVTRFYDQEKLLGEIGDPGFGPAFLSIWLDSRSVVRDLRVRLLGDDSAVANR